MIDIVNSVQQFAPTLYSIDNSRYLESQKYMLEKIDESNLAAQNAATQLASAIGSLDFNESERWYKNQLLNEYDAMINGALDKYSGNLRLAMNDIAAKSRELSTSPEVLGRVQTNEQYKEWKQGIEKRQDISQDVKDYIIGITPYKFELQETEIKDENGNPVLNENGEKVTKITGYKDFEGKEPVTQYTNMDIHKHILSILNPDTTGNSEIKLYYTDTSGRTHQTDDIRKAQYYIDESGKMEYLTEEKITDAIYQTLNDTRIDASLRQDYDVTAHKYKDGEKFLLNGQKYTINNNGQIVDKKGHALSYTEYEVLRLKDITKTYGYTKFMGDTKLQSLITKTDKDNEGPSYIPINPPTPTPTQAGVVEVQPDDPNFEQDNGSKDSYTFEEETKKTIQGIKDAIESTIPDTIAPIPLVPDSTTVNK